MITLDVGAIADTLVDSHLFGHERNAFLGAERRAGVFRAASGGTLFLDQIGELSQPVQSKLLRAVESKEIVPLGADQPLKVDTRIVAATAGSFRHDLLHRLAVVEIRLRPGNVRELSNVVEQAVILAAGETLERADLPAELGGAPAAPRRLLPEVPGATEPEALDLETATTSFQRHHVSRVLDRANGNREAAAQLLGLAPATLYRYLQKLGLNGYASANQ